MSKKILNQNRTRSLDIHAILIHFQELLNILRYKDLKIIHLKLNGYYTVTQQV